jgi:hypothetical protein
VYATSPCYRSDDDLVFCHPQTGRPYDPSKLRSRFYDCLACAGVRRLTFHEGPYAPEAWKVRDRIKGLDAGEAEPDAEETGKVPRYRHPAQRFGVPHAGLWAAR